MKQRLDEVDLLRGVAIAAVVALHVSWRMLTPATLAAPGGSAIAAVHLASGFGVPLFVALSAFGLLRGHGEPFGGVAPCLAFLAKRLRRLLPAYLLWSLVSVAAGDPSRLVADPAALLRLLATGGADIQFYFVPMIVELYLLWPPLRPLAARAAAMAVLPGRSAVAALVAVALLAAASWMASLRYTLTSLDLFAPWVAAGIFAASPAASRLAGDRRVVLCGVVLAVQALSATHARFLAATTLSASPDSLLLSSMIFQLRPGLYAAGVLSALAAAAPLLLAGGGAAARSLVVLGRESYGVFLVHLLVASSAVWRLFDFEAALQAGTPATLAAFAAAWSLTLGASWALSHLLARTPGLRWTVGA